MTTHDEFLMMRNCYVSIQLHRKKKCYLHEIRDTVMHGIIESLQWRRNERDDVSNHQPRDCLLNRYSGADQRKYQSLWWITRTKGQ